MDFIHGKIRPIYFKYLAAAFGSALVTSTYSIVDMAMVGQYQGPDGTAALAVVAPIWNIIYSLGLLMGIGCLLYTSNMDGYTYQEQMLPSSSMDQPFVFFALNKDEQLDLLLPLFRMKGIPHIPYKAVLTPVSYTHLKVEYVL